MSGLPHSATLQQVNSPGLSAPAGVAGSLDEAERLYRDTISDLQRVYRKKIKPLEKAYMFERFHSEPLTDQDISARPMVLLIGQYSTGKTTFMEYFLGQKYPGAHIGIEPTTDRFVAVMHGKESQIIPGNSAAVAKDLPFNGLGQFGEKFLSRFQVSQMDNPLLQNLTFIDSPGILSGTKQVNRGYDFAKSIRWFIERSDLVLLLFDSHKLDISDEFRVAIDMLAGHEDKTRIVLNKCNQVNQQELMRVYGALMWSLGRVITTPEVIRVYLGSFWPASRPPLKHAYDDTKDLLEQEQRDLLCDLRLIPKNAAMRKLNEIVKRARQTLVHAYICGHIKSLMPTFGSKEKKLKTVMENLDTEFAKLQQKYNLAQGDFPDVEAFKHNCQYFKAKEFPKLDTGLVNTVKDALNNDFSRLMKQFPSTTSATMVADMQASGGDLIELQGGSSNVAGTSSKPPAYSAFSGLDKQPNANNPFANGSAPVTQQYPNHRYIYEFNQGMDPATRTIDSSAAGQHLSRWNLDNSVLAEVWDYADWNHEGRLDGVQFEAAMRICEYVHSMNIPPNLAKKQAFEELRL